VTRAPGIGETLGRSDGGYWAFISSRESDRRPDEQNLVDSAILLDLVLDYTQCYFSRYENMKPNKNNSWFS
jgi:hypothetical protein